MEIEKASFMQNQLSFKFSERFGEYIKNTANDNLIKTNQIPLISGWKQVCKDILISMWGEKWQGIHVQREDRKPLLLRPWNAEVQVGGFTDRWRKLGI